MNKHGLRHYYNKDESRWHHVWHQSDLKKLDMCPEQARLIWGGDVNDIQGDGAALGTACHYAVEEVLNLKGADPREAAYGDLVEAFDQGLSDITPTIEGWNSYKTVDKMAEGGQAKLDGWYNTVYPDLSPSDGRVEEKFSRVFYEDDDLSVRAAYNWRSDFLQTPRDVIFPFSPVYGEATGQLDASIFYTLTPQIKLGIQGVNLLDEVTRTSTQIDFDGNRITRSAFRNDRRYTFLARFDF